MAILALEQLVAKPREASWSLLGFHARSELLGLLHLLADFFGTFIEIYEGCMDLSQCKMGIRRNNCVRRHPLKFVADVDILTLIRVPAMYASGPTTRLGRISIYF